MNRFQVERRGITFEPSILLTDVLQSPMYFPSSRCVNGTFLRSRLKGLAMAALVSGMKSLIPIAMTEVCVLVQENCN